MFKIIIKKTDDDRDGWINFDLTISDGVNSNTTNCFVSDEHINNLIDNLKKFSRKEINEFSWDTTIENVNFGKGAKLLFIRKSNDLDHIILRYEIFFKFNDLLCKNVLTEIDYMTISKLIKIFEAILSCNIGEQFDSIN